MELLLKATDRIDLHHARHRSELRFDDPVLDRAELDWAYRFTIPVAGPRLRLDGEHVDFAQTRGHRTHGGLNTRGELILDLLDALVNELPGEVDVGAVGEHDSDLAQPVARKRSGILKMRQPSHRRFYWKRDALLHFKR